MSKFGGSEGVMLENRPKTCSRRIKSISRGKKIAGRPLPYTLELIDFAQFGKIGWFQGAGEGRAALVKKVVVSPPPQFLRYIK